MQIGQLVECIEKPGWLGCVTRGKQYVVNGTEKANGSDYIKILGDDDRAHTLLESMFKPVNPSQT